jgi:cytochrome c5
MLLLALWMPLAQAERTERSGAEVVAESCAACHLAGEQGAPRIGDATVWAPRVSQGLAALTSHALQGIRNMPAHGADASLSDIEVVRAIIEMVNRSGGHWVEPIHGATPAVMRTGEMTAQTHCAQCHRDGLEGAPRIGDRAAWIPRLSRGLDRLVQSAVHGHGGMPPRGGVAELSDAELRSAVLYMFNYGVKLASAPPPGPARPADPLHKVAAGADVYLGVMRADRLQGVAPQGKDVYYLNVSLVDSLTRRPVPDAQIELRVADPLGAQTKTLEAITANDAVSYGAYFRMSGPNPNPYTITATIRRPGYAGTDEARFEYRPR